MNLQKLKDLKSLLSENPMRFFEESERLFKDNNDFIVLKSVYNDFAREKIIDILPPDELNRRFRLIIYEALNFIDGEAKSIEELSKKAYNNLSSKEKIERSSKAVNVNNINENNNTPYPYLKPSFLFAEKSKVFFEKVKFHEYSERREDFYPVLKTSLCDYVLKDFLNGRAYQGNKDLEIPPNILFLYGAIGQGKTTFCRSLVEALSEQNFEEIDYYFIPLYIINSYKDFYNNPTKFIFDKYGKKNKKTLLFILDGLNEIRQVGGRKVGQLESFLGKLTEITEENPNYKFLITCRTHFLPIKSFKDPENFLIVKLQEFSDEQLNDWLDHMGNEKGLTIEENIKIKSDFANFESLLKIPITLELIQEIFTRKEELDNVTVVRRLTDRIWLAKWDKNRKAIKGFPKHTLRFHKAVAILIEQSEEKGFSIDDLEQKIDLIKYEIDSSDKNLFFRDLVSSFLYKEYWYDPHRKNLISFANDYIKEYLYANVLIEILDELSYFIKKEKTGQNFEAFKTIWEHFTKYPINESIFEILQQLIDERSDESKEDLKLIMSSHLENLLEFEFLFHYDARIEKPPPIEKCLDGFYFYWHLLRHLAPAENLLNRKSQDNLLKIFQLDRSVQLRPFDLSYQRFEFHLKNQENKRDKKQWNFPILIEGDNFTKAKISNCEMSNALINGSTLNGIELTNVTLNHCKFENCFLKGGIIRNTDFSGSTFSNIDFSRTIFEDTIFNEVVCQGNFTKVKFFKDDNLSNSNFTNSDFTRATFMSTVIVNTDLTETRLNDTTFNSCTLDDSIMIKVEMDENTNFDLSTLRGVELGGVISISFEKLYEILSRMGDSALVDIKLPEPLKAKLLETHSKLFYDPEKNLDKYLAEEE